MLSVQSLSIHRTTDQGESGKYGENITLQLEDAGFGHRHKLKTWIKTRISARCGS